MKNKKLITKLLLATLLVSSSGLTQAGFWNFSEKELSTYWGLGISVSCLMLLGSFGYIQKMKIAEKNYRNALSKRDEALEPFKDSNNPGRLAFNPDEGNITLRNTPADCEKKLNEYLRLNEKGKKCCKVGLAGAGVSLLSAIAKNYWY